MDINYPDLDKFFRCCVDKSGSLLYLKLVNLNYWRTIDFAHAKNWLRASVPGCNPLQILNDIEYWHLAVGSDLGSVEKRTMRYGPTPRGQENKAEWLRIFVENNFLTSSKPLRRTTYSWKHAAEAMSGEYHFSEVNEFAVACRDCGIHVDDDGTVFAKEIQ